MEYYRYSIPVNNGENDGDEQKMFKFFIEEFIHSHSLIFAINNRPKRQPNFNDMNLDCIKWCVILIFIIELGIVRSSVRLSTPLAHGIRLSMDWTRMGLCVKRRQNVNKKKGRRKIYEQKYGRISLPNDYCT